ncbi:four helix bundle protein, partial [Caldithrix abyssi]|nr:four helix bundle protein [Caldithrix abyssi]
MNKSEQLENRLIDFAVDIMNLAETLPNTRSGNYISGQIIRSGTAPALLYGEVRAAESKKDFIHKMKIALKELRETLVSLKIILKKQ